MVANDRVAEVFRRQRLVKVCGLREPEHAVAAARAGADFLSFIFAPARRQVSADVARAAIDAARQAAGNHTFVAVGVFVDEDSAEILEAASGAGLDLVQLSGGEPPQFVSELGMPAIKALRPLPGTSTSSVIAEIASYRNQAVPPVAFLVDAYSPTAAGGTGAKADWDLAATLSDEVPILLAGGLKPENVGEAIQRVRPLGVDVSSGVEIDGVKSTPRIEQFVSAAREAFLALDVPPRPPSG